MATNCAYLHTCLPTLPAAQHKRKKNQKRRQAVQVTWCAPAYPGRRLALKFLARCAKSWNGLCGFWKFLREPCKGDMKHFFLQFRKGCLRRCAKVPCAMATVCYRHCWNYCPVVVAGGRWAGTRLHRSLHNHDSLGRNSVAKFFHHDWTRQDKIKKREDSE